MQKYVQEQMVEGVWKEARAIKAESRRQAMKEFKRLGISGGGAWRVRKA